jgi:hypothetical protein
MDFDTRIAVRRQIDAVMRKRIGIPQAQVSVTRSRKQGDAGRRWDDGQVLASLQGVAAAEGVPLTKLTTAAYRRRRDADPSIGLSLNALRPRLAAGVPNCPRRLK